jgi:hypothetical protein
VADTGNQTLRKIAPDERVTTVAGRAGSRGTRDGSWFDRLDDPSLVALDGVGTVYVDSGVDNNIRRVSASGMITTLEVEWPRPRQELGRAGEREVNRTVPGRCQLTAAAANSRSQATLQKPRNA